MPELSTKHIEECLMCVETHVARQAVEGSVRALGIMAARARGELEALEEIRDAREALVDLGPKALALAAGFAALDIKCSCGKPNCQTVQTLLAVALDIMSNVRIVEVRK